MKTPVPAPIIKGIVFFWLSFDGSKRPRPWGEKGNLMNTAKKGSLFLFSFLLSVNFYTPVFASFFKAVHQLTSSQITLLFACSSFATFFFEIPTGLIGDKIGERAALRIGAGLTAVSTFFFIVGNTLLLYIGEIIFAIGSTFFSGPFEALVYKSCMASGDADYYSKIISKVYSLLWIALCFSFLGCFLFSNIGGVAAPFYATLVFNIFTFLVSFTIPKVEGKNSDTHPILILGKSIQDIAKNRELGKACVLDALVTMLLICGYQILQNYLVESQFQMQYNGLLYFVAALVASCGSFFFDRIQVVTKSKLTLSTICMTLLAVCFFGLAFVSNALGIVLFVCGYRLVWGITSPMFAFLVNTRIQADESRDTVFSVISLVTNLFGSVLLFVFSVLGLKASENYILLGIIALVLLIVLFLSRRLRSSK